MSQAPGANTTSCVDCGGTVSYESQSCPHCGSPEPVSLASSVVEIRGWDTRLCKVDGWQLVTVLEFDRIPDDKWRDRLDRGLSQYRSSVTFPDVAIGAVGTRRIQITGHSVQDIEHAARYIRRLTMQLNGSVELGTRRALDALLDAPPPHDPET